MNKKEVSNDLGTYIDIHQAASEINTGIATARKYAEKAKATVHIGKCLRIDRQKFLDYIAQQNCQKIRPYRV